MQLKAISRHRVRPRRAHSTPVPTYENTTLKNCRTSDLGGRQLQAAFDYPGLPLRPGYPWDAPSYRFVPAAIVTNVHFTLEPFLLRYQTFVKGW